MSNYYLTKDELYHHGILGQKWGIRRFQNPDGSYTAEGKKRRHGIGTVERDKYKKSVKRIKTKYVTANKNILTDKEKAEKRRIEELSEYWRTNSDKKKLDSYRSRLVEGHITNATKKREELRKAKAKYKSTEEYKLRRAVTIGSAVVGTALAAYGGYKINKYLKDQKQLMSLVERSDLISRLIPQYSANIDAIQKGKMSLNYFDGSSDKANERALKQYSEVVQKYSDELKQISNDIDSISKSHLYNFGKKVTKQQYDEFIKNSVGVLGSIGRGTLTVGKEVGEALLEILKSSVRL